MPDLPNPASRYRDAGVDIDAGDALIRMIAPLARSTARPGANGGIGGFGGVFDPKALGMRDPLLVAGTDGVGTKLRLLTETGRLAVAGIDAVAMCVNDVVAQGAEPLFFLDYYAAGKLVPEEAATVIGGVAEGCKRAGCALIGGETAEMPGHYAPGDFDLAGFVVGAVERENLLPHPDVAPGDVVLGLGSDGIHANGFSLVRAILRDAGADLAAPAPFDATISLADALLAPTRIYVRTCLAAIAVGGVKALAHITGGGLVENLPRVLPHGARAVLDAKSWPVPTVFRWLAEAGRVPPAEMARTFNMGLGMTLVVASEATEAVTAALEAAGERVFRVGAIEAHDGPAAVVINDRRS